MIRFCIYRLIIFAFSRSLFFRNQVAETSDSANDSGKADTDEDVPVGDDMATLMKTLEVILLLTDKTTLLLLSPTSKIDVPICVG